MVVRACGRARRAAQREASRKKERPAKKRVSARSKVAASGHFGCFGRFEVVGSAFVHGSGLRNGRTEFPIGRSAVRTTIGKVRTCGRIVRRFWPATGRFVMK